MSITIANLVAQIGADLTQFKVGMNEVDSRLKLTDIKAKNAAQRVNELRTAAAAASGAAKVFEQERYNQGRDTAGLRNKERNAALIVEASKAYNNAQHDLYRQSVKDKKPVAVQNKLEEMWAGSEDDLKHAQDMHRKAERELAQHYSKMNAIYRDEQRSKTSAIKKSAMAEQYEEESKAIEAVSRAYAERMTQNANAHKIRAANAVASVAGNIGLAGTGGLGVATKFGSDYNQMMMQTAHNTSLSTEGVGVMNQAVAKLGAESGASLEGLAGGFREIENRGYSAAQAVQILTPAMQAAVAKGGDLSATTRLLTNIMKEFGIPVERASDAMGVLVETSRRSGTEMSELVDVFGTMSAYSANLGVSLSETSAAYIVLTRHGLDAHQAATQFKNDINKIINPSKQVIGVLKDLQKHTKLPLLSAFSGAGLRKNGLFGTMDMIRDTAKAYKGGVPNADLVTKLFPLQRGQLGASILTGTGFAETAGVLRDIKAAENGGVALNKIYKESLGQLNQQMDRLKNAAILVASSVATALSPSIQKATTFVNDAVTGFNTLDQSTKSAAVEAVAVASGMLLASAAIGKTIVAVETLNTALKEMGMANGIMGLVRGFGPMGLAIGALAAAGYALWHITSEMALADQRGAEQTRARADALQVSTRSHYENGEQVLQLVQQYQKLAGQTHHTNAETARMHEILDKISGMAPDLVTGFDAGGHAISLVGNAAGIAAEQLYNMGVQARVAKAAVLDLQAAQALAKVNDLKEKQRVTAQQLNSGTVNMTGERERQQYGANLGGQWRPATPQEISGKAPGLKKVGGEDFMNLLPGHHGILPGPTSYFVPQREKEDDGRDKIFGNMTPEMRALAAQKRQVDTDVAAAQRQHDDLIKQANDALNGKGDPLARAKLPPFPHPDAGDGVDHTAGLGEKQKKEKQSKAEQEAQQLKDKYLQFIDSQRESMYMTNNSGMFGENADHAKAMWQTMSHGAVEYMGHMEQLRGDFYKLGTAQKDNAVIEATAAAKRKESFEQDKKWLELQKQNALAAFTAEKNPDRTAKTPAQIAAFKLAQGGYRDYGAHAGEAAASDAATQQKAINQEMKERISKLMADITEPAKGERTVAEQTKAGILADPEMAKKLGPLWISVLSMIAQHSHDVGEATKLYTSEVDKAHDAVAELHREDDGTKSQAAVKELELKDKKYKDFSATQKQAIVDIYKEADAVKALNDQNKANKALKAYLDAQKLDAKNTLAGATLGGAAERAIDFHQKAHEAMGEQWKKMGPTAQAGADQDIEVAFQEIESQQTKIKAARRLSDSLEEVKQKTMELTRVNKVNVDGINISTSEWDKLTDVQKKNVEQFQKLYTARTTIGDVLQGIDDMFSKTLTNIKEHGFKSFFKDIITGFDDMLFAVAQKWATSQFAGMVNGGIDGALSGLFGVKGGASTSGTPGIAGGGGSSGGGGILGSLLGSVLGMFGGGHSAGAAGVAPSSVDTSGIDSLVGSVGGFLADGGTTRAGMSYIVGEEGPELFMPGRSGTVVPHERLKGMGGGDVHVHLHGITDASSFQSSRHQVFQGIQRAILQTQQR